MSGTLALRDPLAGLPIPPLVRRLLGVLYESNIASRQRIFAELYGMRPESKQPEIERIIDVHLCRLRRRLKPEGIVIRVSRAKGWYLKPEDKEKLRAWLERQ